jgi:hypothetical protein
MLQIISDVSINVWLNVRWCPVALKTVCSVDCVSLDLMQFTVCSASSFNSDLKMACNPVAAVHIKFILLRGLNKQFNKKYTVCNVNVKCGQPLKYKCISIMV